MSITKMYLREWNGVRLLDVAKAKNADPKRLCKSDIYEEFYRRLHADGFKIGSDWISSKANLTDITKNMLLQYSANDARIISVGAGLGVVEEPLIRAGWDITLQECQGESFSYLKEKKVEFKELISNDLSVVETNAFDLCLMYGISYVFSQKSYAKYAKELHRIIKPGEFLFMWDPVGALTSNEKPSLVQRIKNNNFIRKLAGKPLIEPDVFWGWIRSADVHLDVFYGAGFELIEYRLYGADWGLVADRCQAHHQFFVFQKK